MFSYLFNNCLFPLFCSNFTAKFDKKKQAKFHKIKRNLDFSESIWTFPGIFLNIPRNLFEHSPESLIMFPGIFSNILRNILLVQWVITASDN